MKNHFLHPRNRKRNAFPEKLCRQFLGVLQSVLGPYDSNPDFPYADNPLNGFWEGLVNYIKHDEGLETEEFYSPPDQLLDILLFEEEKVVFRSLHFLIQILDEKKNDIKKFSGHKRSGLSLTPEQAIPRINEIFNSHGFPFKYESGQLRRTDSEFIEEQVISPAFKILDNHDFSGPLEELHKAHSLLSENKIKESIVNSNNAFESTMKAICKLNNWAYNEGDTAKKLINLLIVNGLIDSYLSDYFNNFVSTLIGISTVRNKTSGHGQGIVPKPVQKHYAEYVLNSTSSNIIFLISCHESINNP